MSNGVIPYTPPASVPPTTGTTSPATPGTTTATATTTTITIPSPFGKTIPKLWGRTRVKGGIIWARLPSVSKNGKISCSFAVAFGQTAIDGGLGRILKLWIGGQMVFDASGGSSVVKLTGVSYKLYNGSEDQQPDPTIVRDKGNLTPAFRGLVYAVVADLELTQYGSQLPEIEADVAQLFDAETPVKTFQPTNLGTGAHGGNYEWGLVDYTRQELYCFSRLGNVAWDTYSLTTNAPIMYSQAPVAVGIRTGERIVPCWKNSLPWAYVMDDDLSNSTVINLMDLHTGAFLFRFGSNNSGTVSGVGGLAHLSDWAEGRRVGDNSATLFVGTSWGEAVLVDRNGVELAFRKRTAISAGQIRCITPADIEVTSGQGDAQSFALPNVDATSFSVAYACTNTNNTVYRMVATTGGNDVVALARPRTTTSTDGTQTYATGPTASGKLSEGTITLDTSDARLSGLSFFGVWCGPSSDPWVSVIASDGAKWFICVFDTAWSRDWSKVPQTTSVINMEYFALINMYEVPAGFFDAGFRHSTAFYQMRSNDNRIGYTSSDGSKWFTVDVYTGDFETFDQGTSVFHDEDDPTHLYLRPFTTYDIGDPVRSVVYYVVGVDDISIHPATPGVIRLYNGNQNTLNLGVFMRSLALTTKAYTADDVGLEGLSDIFIAGAIINESVSLLALESQIAGLFRVDIVESGGKINFIRKTRESGLTIDAELVQSDLALLSDQGGDFITRQRDPSYDLPSVVTLDYLDKDNGNAVGTQSAKRTQFPVITTDTVASLPLSVPIIMKASEALFWATFAMFDMWNAAVTSNFRVGQRWINLEPGDFIKLTMDADADGNVDIYVMKVVQAVINSDFSIQLTGKTFAQFASFVAPVDATSVTDGGDKIGIPPETVPDTTPAVPWVVDNLQVVFAVRADGNIPYEYFSPRATVLYTKDGTTYLGYYLGGAPQGFATTKLNAPVDVWAYDTLNTLTVRFNLPTGLSTVTDDEWLAGANQMLIGLPGRWELVYFRDVTANADGSYTLATFLRGRRGTEWTAGLHIAGDMVVIPAGLGDFAVSPAATGTLDLGTTVAGQIGTGPSGFGSFVQAFGPIRPFAPLNLRATASTGDVVLAWNRRDRAETPIHDGDGTDAMSETTEAYEIDVYKAGSVVRTLTATSETVTYTAAMQTTDTQTTPMLLIDFAVYQMSAVAGRGYGTRKTADVM